MLWNVAHYVWQSLVIASCVDIIELLFQLNYYLLLNQERTSHRPVHLVS